MMRRFLREWLGLRRRSPRLNRASSGTGARPTNSELFLPPDYVRRDANHYFDIPALKREGQGTWQPDVYPFADVLAHRMGAPRVVDIGCGDGGKLAALSPGFERIGVDHGPNLRAARSEFRSIRWVELDLDGSLDPLLHLAQRALVVCSDVLEHLHDPRRLLELLGTLLPDTFGVVLSTPDRDRARGTGDLGPPANAAHTMEWRHAELAALMDLAGLPPLLHGFTRHHSDRAGRNTQVAFIPGRSVRAEPLRGPAAGARLRAVLQRTGRDHGDGRSVARTGP